MRQCCRLPRCYSNVAIELPAPSRAVRGLGDDDAADSLPGEGNGSVTFAAHPPEGASAHPQPDSEGGHERPPEEQPQPSCIMSRVCPSSLGTISKALPAAASFKNRPLPTACRINLCKGSLTGALRALGACSREQSANNFFLSTQAWLPVCAGWHVSLRRSSALKSSTGCTPLRTVCVAVPQHASGRVSKTAPGPVITKPASAPTPAYKYVRRFGAQYGRTRERDACEFCLAWRSLHLPEIGPTRDFSERATLGKRFPP